MTTTADPPGDRSAALATPSVRTPAVPDPAGDTPSPATPIRTRSAWAQLRPLVLRMHFYAGVLVAPFVLVACLTGLAYVFFPQLADLVYGQELMVADGPRDHPRSIDEQVAAAVAHDPGGTLSAVVVQEDPDRTTSAVFDVPGLGEEIQRTVYVDPYTGQVRGMLDTWDGATPLQTTLDLLHKNLLLGTPGRIYTELAASWMAVLIVGGLALWFGKRRRARVLLLPPVGAGPGRGRIRGWHATTSVWMLVATVFITVTGLTWSMGSGSRFLEIVTALEGRTPQLAAEPVPVREGVPQLTPGQVLERARAVGMRGRVQVVLPPEAGEPFTVFEKSDTFPIQRDKLAMNPYTGGITENLPFSERPVISKLTQIGILMHMGLAFGLVNQLGLAAMAIGLICVLFWGYRMAWLRRPTRRGVLPVAPGSPGTFRSLSQPVAFAVVLVTVAAGWLMPAFGLSLLLFLLVDLLLVRGARRRRERAAAA